MLSQIFLSLGSEWIKPKPNPGKVRLASYTFPFVQMCSWHPRQREKYKISTLYAKEQYIITLSILKCQSYKNSPHYINNTLPFESGLVWLILIPIPFAVL